ncbi:unnamed protein product [Ranitomeya imitator]|uniref:rRNA N(6)-adenosine-methyltransferase ZCCHC4 n=1 Tax=Ranitomeya imitator TaxID=111125 RepID=A0ABN9LUT1_9NEOB|nr:unnamed protein product [Ranitomeya imitator]
MDEAGEAVQAEGIQVLLSAESAPHCPHGPTLLFVRTSEGKEQGRRFYACSACRDRKDCRFFQWADEKVSEARLQARAEYNRGCQPPMTHPQYMARFQEFIALPLAKRKFCRDCQQLLLESDWQQHRGHHLLGDVSVSQMKRPSQLLHPLENKKSNAQYLFTDRSCAFILDAVTGLGCNRVLCVGTPRLHEWIRLKSSEDSKPKVKSVLLDIDYRTMPDLVAGVCQQFLQDEGLEAMDWPARSPDLNPIEHIWDIMSRTIHQHHVEPQTVQELADVLVQEEDAASGEAGTAPRAGKYTGSAALRDIYLLLAPVRLRLQRPLAVTLRYSQFYGKDEFCHYNMFNHHFFGGEICKKDANGRCSYISGRREHLSDVSTEEDDGRGVIMVTDPPFGGLVEPLAFSFKRIGNMWRSAADKAVCKELPMFWIFPYFFEARIVQCFPDFSMLDYQVDYDNHTLYKYGKTGRKQSPVRIFTNISPESIVLPASEGYSQEVLGRELNLIRLWKRTSPKNQTIQQHHPPLRKKTLLGFAYP